MQNHIVLQALLWWATTKTQDQSNNCHDFWPTKVLKTSSEDIKPCPRVPQCDCWTYMVLTKPKTVVSCSQRNLKEVPTDLPNNTVYLDLAANKIESLGKNRFTGYPDLKYLDLSSNQLEKVDQEAFSGLQKLEKLHLRNNSIRYNNTGLPPGIFKPLTRLQTLDIQQNFTRNDFGGENYMLEALKDLPTLKTLHLDGMPEKRLGDVFTDLKSLEELVFNGKSGRCLLWELTTGFFPSNTSISKVTIQSCEMKVILAKSFNHLSNLCYLDLSFNEDLTFRSMINITDGLNTEIHTLKLNKLHPTFGPCNILTKENLRGLKDLKLKEIYFNSNKISTIEKGAVKYLPDTLETISLRDNTLAIDLYILEFIASQKYSNLRKLILADQYVNHFADLQYGSHLSISYTKRDLKPQLNILHTYNKGVIQDHKQLMKRKEMIFPKHSFINEEKADPPFEHHPKFEKPAAHTNNLSSGVVKKDMESSEKKSSIPVNISRINHKPLEAMSVNILKKEERQLPKHLLKEKSKANKMKRYNRNSPQDDTTYSTEKSGLDTARQGEEEINRKFAEWLRGYPPITLPNNLTYLDASNMKIRIVVESLNITVPNNLQELNLSRNIFYEWRGPYFGFENLTKLDVSWNSCSFMKSNVLENMPNLVMLNFSKNYLDTSLSSDDDGIIFCKQGKLETLVLSDNRIRHLPQKIFAGLKNLNSLELGKNLLKTFNVDLSHMNKLNELQLYDNQLETISKAVRTVLDQHAEVTKNFTLNLENNNLKCDCENLDFIKWLSESPVTFVNSGRYVCYFKNRKQGNLTNVHSIYSALEKECANYVPIIISSTAALVLVISLTVSSVVYRLRWNLRYIYYMARYRAKGQKSKLHGYEAIGSEDDEIKNINVSYSDDNSGFVRQKIHIELEVKRGLKLYLRHRDAPVDGRLIHDNILDAIENSRKTLIIMSKAYLKHDWCIFEMNMAGIKALKADSNMLCVLMLEEVSSRDLPLKIMRIIKDQEYIEYPGDENLQDCFWDRLKAALTD